MVKLLAKQPQMNVDVNMLIVASLDVASPIK
jgi:hypothetical protein